MKFALPLFVATMVNMVSAQELDIPGTAVDAGTFGTLVAALGAADLVGALSTPNGPFTVFAPTDDVFAALPEGLVDCLLLPENVGALSSILTYHVVEGSVLSTDLVDGMEATTLQGEAVVVDLTDGVKINTSTVVSADIAAANGVIHVIDSVLVPPSIDVAAFLASCPTPTDEVVGIAAPTDDIPTTAISNGSFQTLVAALSAADLVGDLSTPNGPFTVFAPADSAFEALPAGLVDCLVKPENAAVLSGILTYHVVEGEVLSSDLSDGMVAGTLNGANVTVDLTDGVKIGSSTVLAADVLATNGVIHVIDSVLVPPGVDVGGFLATCGPMEPTTAMDIPSTAVAAGSFGTLVAALTAADLVSTLGEPNGPYTVFAPSDDAFAGLPEGLVECLVMEENKDVLTGILTYHVVAGKVMSTDLEDSMMATTLNGADITVDLTMGVKINSSKVVQADIEASNGVIHVIDSVLVPADVDVAGFLASCKGMGMMEPTMAPVMTPDMMSSDETTSMEDGATSFGMSLAVTAISALVAFAM